MLLPAALFAASDFTATAYCLRGRTASGLPVRTGLVAADPRLFPLGTRLLIDGAEYLVADTGGAIRGRRLDIWMASCSEARRFGRRRVRVETLPYGNQKDQRKKEG